MTKTEWQELIDLAVSDELPEALHARLTAQLQSDPVRRHEYETLRATAERLKAVPAASPDEWFVERTLDGLLRENFQASPEENTTIYTQKRNGY